MLARIVPTIAITSALLLGSGCASDSASEIQLPAPNIEQWVLPLDQFMATTDDTVRRDYAEALLVQPCMQSAGYPYDVPWRDLSRTHGDGQNPVGARLFTVEIAAQWGYGLPPSPEPTLDAWISFGEQLSLLPADGLTQLRTCIDKARLQLPILDNEHNYAAGLAFAAYDEAERSDIVVDATQAWRDCMAPLGVADLPMSPLDMPPESVVNGREERLNHAAGLDEFAVATADATCRKTSGFRDAYYAALWEAEAHHLSQNLDSLTRNTERIEEVRDLIQVILGDGVAQ